jgi:hypothetical protein
MKILVVGIVKDLELVVENQIRILQSALFSFGEILWYLVESDSNDKTVEILNRCKERNQNFNFCSLGKLNDIYPERTVRLAYCRNKYIDAISTPKYDDCDYVVVADFDNANLILTFEMLHSVFSRSNQWDVLTANQSGPYYDVFALRHKFWNPVDCEQAYQFYNSIGLKKAKSLQLSVLDKMIHISPDSSFIRVESAFGGLAIYKKHVISGRLYSGLDDEGNSICEHVPLNLSISKDGYRIFIAPSLINLNFNEHNRRATLSYRLLRKIKSFIKMDYL